MSAQVKSVIASVSMAINYGRLPRRTELVECTPRNDRKGFTLVELLVAISIIGILSVIGLTRYSSAQENARTTATLATYDAIYKQIAWRRMSESKFLGGATGLTGNWCSSCSPCGGPSPTVQQVNTQSCIDRLTLSFVTNLGMPTLPRDGWGDPITIDENEEEPGYEHCRYDYLYSAHVSSRRIPLSSLSASDCP